ncbi:MAG: hypothetical protein COB56_03030 [Robiginitomaculum sp.]|nr:MAG: hypothetical protein COB56_03030 [Robiginitomaculum sp.]
MSDINQAQALAKAVHLALSGNVAVQSVLGQEARLYDHAPEDPIYPYLTYGPMRSADVGGDESPMTAHNLTLHLWSRYGGRAETMTMLQAVSGALESGSWQLTEGHLVSVNVIFTDQFRAPDGHTLHGIIRLNATTQP